jgi:hypothetical protein
LQVVSAVFNLLGSGFVLGRGTVDHGGNETVLEVEPVVGMGGGGLVSESKSVEGFVEPFSTAVSREHSPRAIGSVGGGGKPYDEEPSFRVSKVGDGLGVVDFLLVGGAFFPGDFLAIGTESGAFLAGKDFLA